MDVRDCHAAIREAINVLVGGVMPSVERVTSAALTLNVAWTKLLRSEDAAGGRRRGEHRPGDLWLMLRAMSERLANVSDPIGQRLSRKAQNYASQLPGVCNRRAPNEPFSTPNAFQADAIANSCRLFSCEARDLVSSGKADPLQVHGGGE